MCICVCLYVCGRGDDGVDDMVEPLTVHISRNYRTLQIYDIDVVGRYKLNI